MQLQFEITLQDDGELIHMANGTDAGRVVVNRFLLWVPRLDSQRFSLRQICQLFHERNAMEISEGNGTKNQLPQLHQDFSRSQRALTMCGIFLSG